MINHDEVIKVAAAMQKYGGSFVKALGSTLSHADSINAQKIKDTWAEYWARYLKMEDK